jgi:hypothetical protein
MPNVPRRSSEASCWDNRLGVSWIKRLRNLSFSLGATGCMAVARHSFGCYGENACEDSVIGWVLVRLRIRWVGSMLGQVLVRLWVEVQAWVEV